MGHGEPSAFGALLRRSRLEAGLTQEELAERAGISARTISDVERGIVRAPQPHIARQLAEALQLAPAARREWEEAVRTSRALRSASAGSAQVRTFLIADVRGYSRFTIEHGDEAAMRLAAKFASVAREVVTTHGGTVIELRGDEALAAFSSARQALRAALDLEAHAARETAAAPSLPLPIGLGLDAGEAIPFERGYRGAALNLAARLCALAGPGEILASEAVVHLARKLEGVEYGDRGMVSLKGFTDPVRVIEVHPTSEGEPLAAGGTDGSSEVAGASASTGDRLSQRFPIGGFLGALPAGVLVARESEMQRITVHLEAVMEGDGRLLLLAGEPGVGKTRLAQEVTLRLRDRDFLIAGGRCYESEATVAFYPFREALAVLYAAAPPPLRASLPGRWPQLPRLLPDADIAALPASDGQEDEQRLFWSVTGFIEALAAEAPVAILLDDLHWADTSSLKLLQHLARYVRGASLLLLGTYRDVEVRRQHPLESALRDLTREGLAERIAVRRLDERGTAELIAATLGDADEDLAGLVQHWTEGNPFFVQQVLRVLVERGDMVQRNGRWEGGHIDELEIPESIRSVIGHRLSRLSDLTQEMLHEASVLGQTFRFEDLLAIGEREERELESGLEEAIGAGLVREMGRDGYAFDHALTQGSLYRQLSARRRRRLHRAAGEALERLPDRMRRNRVAELALHFIQADDPERAVPYLLQAASASNALFANAEAEWNYRTALELAHEIEDRQAELDALEGLAGVLRHTGRHDEALELLESGGDLARIAHDRDREARIVAQIGWINIERDTPQEGLTQLQALADDETRAVGARVMLLDALSTVHFFMGSFQEQLRTAERAAEIAREIGDERLITRVDGRRALALLSLGQRDEALEILERVIASADALEEGDTLRRALNNAAHQYWRMGDFDRAEAYWQRYLASARREGSPGAIAFALTMLGWGPLLQGDLSRALVFFDEAATLASRIDREGVRLVLATPPTIRLWLGETDESVQRLEECLAQAGKEGNRRLLLGAQEALGDYELAVGRLQDAVTRLTPLMVQPTDEDLMSSLVTLTAALIEVGRLDEARDVLVPALSHAESHEVDTLPIALALRALIAAHEGSWAEAESMLDRALSQTQELGFRWLEALVLVHYGQALAAADMRDRARARLEEAAKLARDIGDALHAGYAERLLARL